MSSRRVQSVPVKTSAAPLLPTNRAVPFRSSIKFNAMRSPTVHNDKTEIVVARVGTLKTSAPVSKDLVANNKMNSKTTASGSSRPLWQSVKSLGSRVSPSIKQSNKEKHKKDEEPMVSSTGTESSGVFSDSENNTQVQQNVPPVVNNRILRPPTTSTSRFTAAMAKTTSKLVSKRPTPTQNGQYETL